MTYAIALHGGAGAISPDQPEQRKQEYLDALEQALAVGRDILAAGGTSMDAVEQTVRFLEDHPLFNAGHGAVLTEAGHVEMDASIMDGRTLASGAVTGVRTVRNPVSLARYVMTDTRHVLLGGEGAEAFAREVGVTIEDPAYFITPRRRQQWERAKQTNAIQRDHDDAHQYSVAEARPEDRYGTVGCVALDSHGNLAAATSTGGLTNKMVGRIGDSPIHGAGNYADNNTAAISGTGIGERFIQYNVAYRVSAIMAYRGDSLESAANEVIHRVLAEGDGGIICVDRHGNIAMPFNTKGMYRAAADSRGLHVVRIWE